MINDNPKPNKIDMGGIRKLPATGLANLSPVCFVLLFISLIINIYL